MNPWTQPLTTHQNQQHGFHNFYGNVYRHDEIHVYKDSSWPSQWRVRGMHGDYGLSKDCSEAISIAIDAKVSSLYDAKIYVHGFGKDQPFVITKVRSIKPSSQFFQDNVE
jgi:hypothetical protein